ncbi:CbiX/SirB N-terminal domain-containing protein [Leisingera sp. NJS204]|uniref:CbiX/SirB N-terminal domain-containing protein n=1 Tax=Leisingera sp. NJS204 TaxID=2508307 RepID=UPI001010BCBA|nr:CbiX/SirB N-terminal domain-containing protein [Leisingera sp. NJS204]QAX29116.1 cobalamin biosynthesis protein CbiX [Leisingera sp. NJS204]
MTKITRTAVITAHGQPSGPAPAEAALAGLAAEVAAHLPDWDVRSSTLATPGRLEREMAEDAVVYPFFMSQGWFTAKVLPGRLQGRSYRMAPPFGLDASLPALAAQAVRLAAQRLSWPLAETHLLLAAHGSARGPKAAEAAEHFAARLRPLLPGCTLSPGYVEQSPRIETAATALPACSICLPFFAQAGDHVKQDIPQALEAAFFQGILLPVTGALPGIPALIAKAIRAAAPGQSADS